WAPRWLPLRYNSVVGARIDLKPCRRCGAMSPKPLSRDGTHRVRNWPEASRGLLCDTCRATHNRAANHPNWRGGRGLTGYGYVWVHTGPRRRAFEHRVVWAKAYGPIPAGFE